ncbi:MAG TPA: NAD(P)-dependent oxidoreductase [Bacteroidia bacterium]|nr:NAD(P)-dependent oxidoreductase [Bacteroidia bacterium]
MIAKTILVTGANGLLGQKLVQKLSRRDAVHLVATSVGPNRNPLDEGYVYESMDITQPDQVREMFVKYEPTEIINTAAMTNVDQCEKEQEACWELNVKAVETQIALCKEFETRMVHISTDFIFDGTAGPYTEKATPNPLSWYGKSKLEAENIVISSGVPYAIARTMLVFGVVQDMSRSNIVLWAKKSLEEGKPITVVNDQWRCPTLAEDLAEGVVLMTMKDKNGIYNISGPDMYSIHDLVQLVADHWKLDKSLITPIDSSTLNQAAKRPAKTGFIILKAQTELGFRPRTFRESLAIVDRQLTEWSE